LNQHALEKIELACIIKMWSSVHASCYPLCSCLSTHNFVCVHMRYLPKTSGANNPPPLLLGSSLSQLPRWITDAMDRTVFLSSCMNFLNFRSGSLRMPWSSWVSWKTTSKSTVVT
jgi:hypothetical protein